MKIKLFEGNQQKDPAGVVGAEIALPNIIDIEELHRNPPQPPPLVIEGILHQGCKMVLAGPSKTNKSWCLLDLAISVATGQKWWGRQCAHLKVLYIDFELQPWALTHRLAALCAARPECKGLSGQLKLWPLRGHSADLTTLRPELELHLMEHEFGLIIIDPAYKLLGPRDENCNGEIANLMNEFERLARNSGAAIVVAHHFAKGDSTLKTAMDRLSGAGVWARDPDAILVLTPHEEDSCFAVTSILRNVPLLPEFVVEWTFPTMNIADDLDPSSLRRPQAKNKVCSDREFLEQVVGRDGKTHTRIVEAAASTFSMSEATTKRYLMRLKEAGSVVHSTGLYWAKKAQNVSA